MLVGVRGPVVQSHLGQGWGRGAGRGRSVPLVPKVSQSQRVSLIHQPSLSTCCMPFVASGAGDAAVPWTEVLLPWH